MVLNNNSIIEGPYSEMDNEDGKAQQMVLNDNNSNTEVTYPETLQQMIVNNNSSIEGPYWEMDNEEKPQSTVVNNDSNTDPYSAMDREDGKQQQQPSPDQTVEISVDDSSIEVEDKSTGTDEANDRFEAAQIQLEISKLQAEAEAKAKAAEAAIEKAKLAWNELTNDTHEETNRKATDPESVNRLVTESIKKTIRDAENQVVFEVEDERVDSLIKVSANDDEKRDDNDLLDGAFTNKECDEPELKDSPVPDPPEMFSVPKTEKEISIVVDLVDPPSIVRQSAVPSPTPDPIRSLNPSSFCTPPTKKNIEVFDGKEEFIKKEETVKSIMAKYTKPKPDPTPVRNVTVEKDKQHDAKAVPTPKQDVTVEVDKQHDVVVNTCPNTNTNTCPDTCNIDGTLESLYNKIEECRAKLMDPVSTMDEQTAAAQLMTKYAKSAQALKKTIKESAHEFKKDIQQFPQEFKKELKESRQEIKKAVRRL